MLDDARTQRLDAVVVGAGFAGMLSLHRLRGMGLNTLAFEAATGVGGTWWWNRYPGARCDVESLQYSYSFDDSLQQDWTWTERYATQPEILDYAEHVADRFDLHRDIRFGARVTSARWDDAAGLWRIETDRGDRAQARFLILATGCLSAARLPEIEGRDSFRGATYHTGDWPHEGVDFSGLRVGVIGAGSSAIQAIPEIARQAAQLTVFQRTANFSVPAWNRPLDAQEIARWKADYPALRRRARESTRNGIVMDPPVGEAARTDPDTREREFRRRWNMGGTQFGQTFSDLVVNPEANEAAAEFVRARIREIVQDPQTAADLCPTDYPIFTKRICVDTDWYATFNLPHVRLANLRRTPIERITETGVRTSDADHPFDAIVYATGFDAMTGAALAIDPQGRDGPLSRKWAEGPRAYLGLQSAGFPNLFLITGPGSPSVLSNMIVSIEQHVEMIADLIAKMQAGDETRVEPSPEAEDAWVAHVNEVANATLFPRAASWYMGANIPGKPRVFMPYIGVDRYRAKVRRIADAGWEGFRFAREPAPA